MAFSSDHRILLIGAPGDVPLCDRIARAAGRGEVLAGKFSLLATAELMHRAKMNFVNDSAPLHITSAMNAPVTAIFCSTVPAFGFGPLRENGRVMREGDPITGKVVAALVSGESPERDVTLLDLTLFDPERYSRRVR